ncbi:hypothetical protein [Bradyrhizobium canariense]|uniref:Uncharacterized protein n=1 Tax=Bradyrhizobium canariense TaxID=255045 RepID=A0A1H1NA82_9BRAD|nr:hypothetical protein [Bradyrhizobium canariense]SDR95882.1 hypothetical protein SAMN05444158_0545 [Bradyrhizobium canariense]
MRQMISGLAAAVAMMAASAAPAMACGFGYGSCAYYAPVPVYSGCNTGCGGWGYERLSDPVEQYHHAAVAMPQYYYVDQGPTYTGPGEFAPFPTYQESALGWHAYRHNPYYYGYDGGRYANATSHYYDGAPNASGPVIYRYHGHSWHAHSGYRYWHHRSIRYGYDGAPHRYSYRYNTHRRYY